MGAEVRENSKRMMNIDEAVEYTGMGRTFFMKWAAEIGARCEFSPRLVRYDRTAIDAELNRVREAQAATATRTGASKPETVLNHIRG